MKKFEPVQGRRARRAILVAPAFALLLLSLSGCQTLVLRVVGVGPFVGERVSGWIARGAEEDDLHSALRKIYKTDPFDTGKGSWVYELERPAIEHHERARALEAQGQTDEAAEAYLVASAFYDIARFPFLATPEKEKAYERHIETYLRAAELSGDAIEFVRIPFEGKEIIGYFRNPGSGKTPVVVMTGGVDTWKSSIDAMIKPFLSEGLAVFAFDMPGTGESQWPLEPNSDRVYSAVLDYLKGRPDVDGERMGVYLVSFAGLYAVKLALTDPDVKAAVNVGGPIHFSFQDENGERIPDVMVKTIRHAFDPPEGTTDEDAIEMMKGFSLDTQGLLKPTPHQAPLLSLNGDEDPLVAIEDQYLISERGVKQLEWVYEGDGHCAPMNAGTHIPQAAAWMKSQLDKS